MEASKSKTNKFFLNARERLDSWSTVKTERRNNRKTGPVSLLLEFPVFELSKFFEFYLSTYKFRLVFIGSSITIKKKVRFTISSLDYFFVL